MTIRIKTYLLTLTLSVFVGLSSCKKKLSELPSAENNQEKVKEDILDPNPETKNKTATTFKTLLRPDQEVKIDNEYIDTIHFINYDDNYDYWFFLAQKNKDTIAIAYDDESITKLSKGEELIIKWKLKYLENAGDPELSETKPFLVSFTPIQFKKLTDKKVKVDRSEDLDDQNLKSKEEIPNSFVISCGSGCTLTYSEHKIEKNDSTTEVTFRVEMYINEQLSDQYLETYIFNCEVSGQSTVRFKGNNENSIESEHPEIQRKLKLYSNRLCNE